MYMYSEPITDSNNNIIIILFITPTTAPTAINTTCIEINEQYIMYMLHVYEQSYYMYVQCMYAGIYTLSTAN